MKTMAIPFLLATAAFGLQAQMPAAPKPAAELAVGTALDATYQWVPGQFISAAEAMPEEKFNFAPTQGDFKGVKTFAEQIKHVAAVNYMVGAAILGEKVPVEVGKAEMGPENLKSKAEIMKFLKDSFAYSRKAIQGITPQNGTQALKSPFGEGTMTPLGMSVLLAFHGMDHYGQMVIYLRMNGIVPPASRR